MPSTLDGRGEHALVLRAGTASATRFDLTFRAGLSGQKFYLLVINYVNLVHAKLAYSWPAGI